MPNLTRWVSPNGTPFTIDQGAVNTVEPFFNRLNQIYPQYGSHGGYAHRPMRTLDGRNLGGLSTHATGYTLDVKAPDAVLRQMHKEFPHLTWGGKFSHYDPVHFEFLPTAQKYGDLPPLSTKPFVGQAGAEAGTPSTPGPRVAGAISAASPMPSPTAGPQPMAQPTSPGQPQPSGFDEFLGRWQSPMTQQGLGILLAAMQNGDLNAGASSGAARGNQALQQYLQMQKMKQEQAKREQVQSIIGGMEGVPEPLKRLALATGDVGPISSMLTRQFDPDAKTKSEILNLDRDQKRFAVGNQPLQAEKLAADVAREKQKAAMDKYVMDLITGGQTPEQPPASPIQPQSYIPQDGPGQDPNLIRTQAAAPGAAPAAQPSNPADPLVDTPLGRKPASEVRRLGLGLALSGKGDAGRMLAESADTTKLGKEARNEIDKGELKATEALARMKEIRRQFKPEFLTYEEQAKQYGISWLDKFDVTRSGLSPEQIQKHVEYTTFRQETVANLNKYINEMTGAAMGIEEAKRLAKAVPTMDDNPTAFQAKADTILRQSQLAIARMRYLRSNGFNGQPWAGTAEDAARDLPIEKFQSDVREAAKATIQQLRSAHPNAPADQINGAARAIVRKRFGIDA